MRYDLAAMTRRVRNPKRSSIPLRTIAPTGVQVSELSAIYVKVVKAIAASVVEDVLPAYAEALARRAADSLVRDDVSKVEQAEASLGEKLRRLILTLTPELTRWALRYEQYHRRKWVAAAYTATTIDLSAMIGPGDVQEEMAVWIARNVALIRDVSAQAQARIADAVFRGYQGRQPPRTVAKAIQEAVAMSRRRAIFIASDQAAKISAALDRERQVQAGITSFTWREGWPAHPRPEHVERDGQVYQWANPPAELPGELPRCTCKAQALLTL